MSALIDAALTRESLLLLGAGADSIRLRPPLDVSHDQIEASVDRIVESLGNGYEFECPSMAVGERVMDELRGLDKVAYVRYASVYRGFEEVSDFVQEVQKLEKRRDDPAQQRLPGVPAL